MYNNLDPDSAEFRRGWDELNKFISYFKFTKLDAQELRRYYIERAEEAKAKSRRRVMRDFSPYLAEKFVWKLNREWLIRVPCFSLVVERLNEHVARGTNSGMERFLVKVAMLMKPSVYVPTERPPPARLYIITEGVALHRGRRITKGDSWGAEDVLLRARYGAGRAIAVSYLHCIWISAQSLHELGDEFREGYMLTKLWASLYAAGEAIIERYRQQRARRPVKIGDKPGMVAREIVEKQINVGITKVVELRSEDGRRRVNARGQPLYKCKWKAIDLTGYEIVKESGPSKGANGKSTITNGHFVVQKTRRDSGIVDDTDAVAAEHSDFFLAEKSTGTSGLGFCDVHRGASDASGKHRSKGWLGLAKLSGSNGAPPASERPNSPQQRANNAYAASLAERLDELTRKVKTQNAEVLSELATLASQVRTSSSKSDRYVA